MRSFLVCSVVGLAVMTMAASSSAQDPIKIGPIPSFEVTPPVHVAGFHRYGQSGAYTGGALGIGVDVENSSDKPVDNVSVKLDIGGGKVLEQSVSVAPHGTRTAVFYDNDGLTSSCKAAEYKIMLSGPGTMNGQTKSALIKPTCTFQSTLEQTWNQMSPDKVLAEKSGNAYLTSPVVQMNANCGSAPTIKVTMINQSSLSSPSVIVQAKEWSEGGKVKSQTSAAFPISGGESKALLLTPVYANAGGEPTTKLHLGIVDWTKSLQGHTSDGGIFVNTTRSCSLAFTLL